jgi:histone deacetylase complex regulatory component SIN3
LCPNSWLNIMEDLGSGFVEAPKFCKRVESILEECWH